MDKDSKIGSFLKLHILFFMYSFGGVCSKYASQRDFFSFSFFLFYGLLILILGMYAIFWQQVIKRLPIVTAYANKAITVFWGMLFGVVLFHESISLSNIIGAIIIIIGICTVVKSDAD